MFTDTDVSTNIKTWVSEENLTNEIEEYTLDRVYMIGVGFSRMFILVSRLDLESEKLIG